MKTKLSHLLSLSSFLILGALLISCGPDKQKTSLKVFVHETFAGSFSSDFNDKIRAFEETSNLKIEWISYGKSPLSILEKMKKDPSFSIDLLYGVDNTTLLDFQESGLFHPYTSQENELLIPEINLDKKHFFTPINYGWLAFEYSQKTWKDSLPSSLMDLTRSPFKGHYILANPRTSDIGLLFALWLDAAGYDVQEILPLFLKNAFSIAPNWGSAYTLYVSGEAPFVLTYSSSPAYHEIIESDSSQKTILTTENSYVHIEFMGITKRSKNIPIAQQFLDYMVSEEVQETLPKKVWVFPARMGTKLPVEFEKVEKPKELLNHTPEQIKELKSIWIASDWF